MRTEDGRKKLVSENSGEKEQPGEADRQDEDVLLGRKITGERGKKKKEQEM